MLNEAEKNEKRSLWRLAMCWNHQQIFNVVEKYGASPSDKEAVRIAFNSNEEQLEDLLDMIEHLEEELKNVTQRQDNSRPTVHHQQD